MGDFWYDFVYSKNWDTLGSFTAIFEHLRRVLANFVVVGNSAPYHHIFRLFPVLFINLLVLCSESFCVVKGKA